MPNSFGAGGLTVATRAELVTQLTTAYQTIYGATINLASDSPDGQWMNLIVQMILDVEDLLVQINSSFDPDNAIGVILDQRVAINGIQRQGGTFTVQPISITTSQALTLQGLDNFPDTPYTVQDASGTQWQLQATQNVASAGTNSYNFQAATPGAVQSTINSITLPVTIVLGVTGINNPSAYTTLGINEESDALLKIRRQKSVSLSSQGYLRGLVAALANINGVTSAFVYENDSDGTDSDGVPSHSIWVIVAGSAAAADIANAIYTKRNAGCGMFGTQTFVITQVDGSQFPVNWDSVVTQSLFVSFEADSIDGINPPNLSAISSQLPGIFMPGVFQEVNINGLATLVQDIDPNTLVTKAGFTTGLFQTISFVGTPASGTFKLSYNGVPTALINWNDSTSTIQTKLQAVTGLSAAVVTGTIAGLTLAIALNAPSALAMIAVTNNSLMTSVPAAVLASNSTIPTTTLAPNSKKNQFTVSAPNIIMTPMILSPYNPLTALPVTVTHLMTKQFTGLGGYGTLTYSFLTNNSSGSIDSSSGLYTAGSAGFQDTIQVTDIDGNTALAIVTVI